MTISFLNELLDRIPAVALPSNMNRKVTSNFHQTFVYENNYTQSARNLS